SPPPASPAPAAPPPAAPVLPKSWGASARCPSCQIAYLPTGTDAHLYCPHCGRLAASPTPAHPPGAPAPGLPTPTTSTTSSVRLGPDRRSQELFAAWVTAQPIPCPKCRTPLRHHGVAEYACPSCGARIAFERSAGVPATTRGAPSPTPVPAETSVVPPAL
ncbi:MAG TPA: hypothetical protein VN864_01635, partial [Thermoplasmata archaeon]|nr:hypothetical protein [Thermoplasmata archaeon]